MKTANWNVLAPLETALAPTEEILRKEYQRQLLAQRDHVLEELAADGWDANKRYDYPYGGMSRLQYAQQKARYNLCEKYTSAVKGCRSMREPNIRVPRKDNAARIAKQAAEMANAALEGYCIKLAWKIQAVAEETHSTVTAIAYRGGLDPWGWSFVDVTTDKGKQCWKTQMIINVSCLGKLFNQWPTRLLA